MPDLDGFFDDATPSPSPESKPDAPSSVAAEKQEAPTPATQTRTSDGKFGHKHPEWLVEQARELGFAEADIAEVPTDSLGRILNSQRKVRASQIQPPIQQPVAQPAPVEETLPDLSAFDPAISETLTKLWGRSKKADALEKELGEVKQTLQRERNTSIAAKLDEAFAAMPEQFHGFIGTGSAADSSIDKADLQIRNLLLAQAGLDTNALPSAKEIKAKLNAAASKVFAKLAAPARATETGGYNGVGKNGKPLPNGPSPEEWAAGGVQRPSQRGGGKEPNGEAKAIANLEAKMRDAGQLPSQMRQEILDGLPE